MVNKMWQSWWQTPASREGDFFLPDFCDVRVVLVVVLAAELFAIVLTLGAPSGGNVWTRFGFTSFFVMWIVLTATATLCRLRRPLAGMKLWQASLAAYGVILFLTALFTDIGWWLMSGDEGFARSSARWTLHLNNLAIAGIIGAVLLRYFYVLQEYRNRLRREAEARVQALQSRIHPHFLFNTMNTLASLTRRDPELAEKVVMDLSDLFRASLAVGGSRVSLKQEWELCEGYLHIEQLRLGERLHYALHADTVNWDAKVPLLSIQPLVENAVYHGIQPLSEGGCVGIRFSDEQGELVIDVSNPLPAKLTTHNAHQGHGVALDNIRERLQVLYGSRARLQTSEDAQHFHARLILPKE